MPENLDINVIFRVPPSAPERLDLAERFFGITKSWIGSPSVVSVFDTSTWTFQDHPWPAACILKNSVSNGNAIRIYGERFNGSAGSLGIEETSSVACYSLAIPVRRLRTVPLESLESTLLKIYDVSGLRGPCVLIAGSELTVACDVSDFGQIIRFQLQDTSLITHIIGTKGDLPKLQDDFACIYQIQDIIVLRSRDAAVRLHLQREERFHPK
jgi:hypothetical protein